MTVSLEPRTPDRATTSLAVQLIAVIMACLLLPALTVGWLGYGEVFESIKNEKIRSVSRVADARRNELITFLQASNAKTAALLSEVICHCVAGAGDIRADCVNETLQSFLAGEKAVGAVLRPPGGADALIVGSPPDRPDFWAPFRSGQLARFSRRSAGRERTYDVVAEDVRRDMRLMVTFPVSAIQSLFVNAPDLGQSGETFLADQEGYFITKNRYPAVQGHSHPISARPMRACLAAASQEILDPDYRDVPVIHGFRFIPEVGGGCIMAHIDQAEAFAPLRALQWRMVALTLLFITAAVLAATAIGRRIAKPIAELMRATSEIIGGNVTARAEVAGNNEISELARSFNRMACTITEREARIRAIIDGTMDAFIGVDLDGVVVAFNHGAEALFAISAPMALGHRIADSGLPASLRQCIIVSLRRAGAGEPLDDGNVDIEEVRTDGRPLVAEANIFATGTGRDIMVIACLRDITERWQAERKTQRLGRILRMMSEGNQAMIRATREDELFQDMCRVIVEFGGYRMAWIGMVEHDEEKTIRPVAHAGVEGGYLALARITWADSALGRGPTGLSVRTGVPQFNNDITKNPVMSPWRAAGLERGYLSSLSLPLKDRAGVFGTLSIYAGEPHAFGADELSLLVELTEDVAFGVMALRTRRDHDALERTLRQAQKMEALGQLTGGIAHDFNNLLQIIIANLDLSLTRLGNGSAVAGYLRNAMTGAEQGARLTGQLLAFARRQPLRPEPLRLDRLVGDLTDILRRTLGERIAIEMVVGGGLWTTMIDANQLQNALLNLAINARDAMPEGGKLTIELNNSALDDSYAAAHREVTPGQYVLLAVTDTGYGMSADTVEHVFEPFFTTKPEGVGTGLGLSMVYGFVKQSGGHIKVYSEIGHGTTVRLYLPRTHKAEAARHIEAINAERGSGETILVAEDDEGVRVSVVTQLAELGYRVIAAANGELALGVLARGERVDLLFTDVVMPGMLNGRCLAEQAHQIVPSLPVLYTSGYTENAIIHHGRLDEGVALLSKPYRLSQLARAVRTALGPCRARVAPGEALGMPGTSGEEAVTPGLSGDTGHFVDSSSPPVVGNAGHVAGGEAVEPVATVLLVEDDEMVRGAMGAILEGYGYRIALAEKPSEALHILNGDGVIDILVTDFTLPEMNGIALIHKALLRRPDLAVILASGHSFDASELSDQRITVLVKPFHPQTLRVAIQNSLEPRHPGLIHAFVA